MKEISLELSRFFQESPALYSDKKNLIPCFIEKSIVSLKKTENIEVLRKKDPNSYYFSDFLLENYYEAIFEGKFPDIFRPDTAVLLYFLTEKYKDTPKEYRVEMKDFQSFFEKMEEIFSASFSNFLMFYQHKKEKNQFAKNLSPKIEIKHMDLSDYVIRTSEKKINISGF